ncbi:MAG: thiamine phosphate synthase [Cyanobacteriota bacterium]|nr:thiamine phosphate synthase [Cyanobacteriota bacterium]
MGELTNSSQFSTPAIGRILDANLDRAREGLRIVEEWCRFGLDDRALTDECKQLRQALASWHTQELREMRDTPADTGTELTHPQERERAGIEHVLQANLCRTQEALRVLEEYGKLHHPKMGEAFKHMRYRVYALDSQLLARGRHQKLQQAQLYLITAADENLPIIVEQALQGGLTLVQYREKHADDATRIEQGIQLRKLCHRYGALFVMNDRVDLALAVDADGVHLGQHDVPVAFARKLLGSSRIIGRSTTNPQEMKQAIEEGADYIGVGPVYETPTKPGKAPAGLEYIRYATENSPVPWFAIGGIDMSNIHEVFSAGARRVSVVRAIVRAEQPTLVTQYFLSQLAWLDTMGQLEATQG